MQQCRWSAILSAETLTSRCMRQRAGSSFLILATSANWGTNQLGDLRVITAVSTSLTLSETLLGNIFGAGGRYRVGDIVISENETSPAEAYGGSWEQITDRFLVGAGGSYTLGSTGGEANVTLTVEQIPPHSHQMNYYNDESTPPSGSDWVPAARRSTGYNVEGGDTDDTGGGQAHNNMPPYIAVNIWRRVA